MGQPIGRKAAKLSNILGTIARNGHLAPLNFIDWRAMPDGSKEKMWQLVEVSKAPYSICSFFPHYFDCVISNVHVVEV